MMKRLRTAAVLAACLGVVPAFAAPDAAPAPPADEFAAILVHNTPFAVVELYTSEGCSSCPPAEALLNRLDRNARQDDHRIFALAFHVDYWNRLGWTDPFSNSAYSDRQRDYAVALRQSSVYTPQMIVNGATGFVGSRAHQAEDEIGRALASFPEKTNKPAPPLGIGFVAEPVAQDGQLNLRWRVDALPAHATLNLAIAENGLSTDVPRGENRGRTLPHEGVVRTLLTEPLATTHGRWSAQISSKVQVDQASAILFVQDTRTGQILAAHRVDLNLAPGQ